MIHEMSIQNEQMKLKIYEIELAKDKILEECKQSNQTSESKKNEKVAKAILPL